MIYVIGDLHLSFGVNKPMNIFGSNWDNHAEKIKNNWIKKVKNEDTVIIPGDFSWATYLDEAIEDFKFLDELPGKKILLKGNHDYWWTTLTNMRKFLKENNFCSIDFLYNNSYQIEDKIIVGSRGWTTQNYNNDENNKILKREVLRLKLSIENAKKNNFSGEMIAFIHYPPFYKEEVEETLDFIRLLKNNNVKKCYYGHLHGESHKDAINGNIDGIEFTLVSSDYLKFDLLKI